MSEKYIPLYLFLMFSFLALVILYLSIANTNITVFPIIISNQSTPTGYFSMSNPCIFPKCYYSEGKYCYNEGELIQNELPKYKNDKTCVLKERLRCYRGSWLYDSSPQEFCS